MIKHQRPAARCLHNRNLTAGNTSDKVSEYNMGPCVQLHAPRTDEEETLPKKKHAHDIN